jgi:starvation-inducible outer membrane lipoprotein
MTRGRVCALVACLLVSACASTSDRVLDVGDQTQLQKRAYQSRIFDTTDKDKVLRAIISTLQDLGFVIDRADYTLGVVSATKLNVYQLKMTVSTRPRGKEQTLVRANAQFNVQPVEDPKPYQDFFASLEKSLFLTAHAGE